MAARQSEKIKLWGIVQGVGFRPYVAKTAEALGIKGQVLNIGGLVEITVTDTPSRISSFIEHSRQAGSCRNSPHQARAGFFS